MELRAQRPYVIPESLDYPALCFSRDRSLVVARDASDLTRCNAVAFWKNRYFEDLLIVDAAGRRFRVESAQPDPEVGAMDQYVARLLNRRFRVNLRLRPEGRMALIEIKRTAIEWIEKAPDFWSASRELSEWSRQITSCRSVVGLARLFD